MTIFLFVLALVERQLFSIGKHVAFYNTILFTTSLIGLYT